MKGSKTMNEIKITTELCAEDRARIDRLTAALEGLTAGSATVGTPFPVYAMKAESKPEPVEAPREDTEAPAEPETVPEEVGAPDDEPEVKEVPEHTKAELQQKVISIVTAGKKDEVKAIIEQYAERVSAIPDEKINEVWDKLTKLEG
jgi:hypothetical protein